jgi:hypothetical protein
MTPLILGPLPEQVADAPALCIGDGACDRAHVLDAVRAKNPAVGVIVSPGRDDRSGPAGFVHSFAQRTWADELADDIRLPSSFERGSGDRPLQAREWRRVASGENRGQGAQPDIGNRASNTRARHLIFTVRETVEANHHPCNKAAPCAVPTCRNERSVAIPACSQALSPIPRARPHAAQQNPRESHCKALRANLH